MGIFSVVGLAVSDANRMARELSLKRPRELIMAVVTRDTGTKRVFISWATPEQNMAGNDTECGWWRGGKNLKSMKSIG
jgi:hypothetical protein